MPELDYEHIDRIVDLIESFLSGEITTAEKDELIQWVCQNEANLALFEKLVGEYSSAALLDEQFSKLESISKDDVEKIFIDCIRETEEPKSFFTKYRQLLSIAAGVLIVVLGGIVWYMNSLDKNPTDPTAITRLFTLPAHVSKPAADRTVIRIGNDQPIIIEKAIDTIVFSNESIMYPNGEIISEVHKKPTSTTVFVETPYNGKINLLLADGSKIGLHPGSSLKFPLSFTETERKVALAGEALFSVQKTKRKQPFKVEVINEKLNAPAQVTVLGTSFWISSLKEQDFFETGVLEGVVEVNYYSGREVLIAGKSAITSNEGIESKEFDLETLSGKYDGMLSWDNSEIGSILLTLKNWYNLNLEVNKDFNLHRKFTITFDPRQEISENLKILTYLGITLKLDSSVYPNKLSIIN
ncbi:FecR family protein [Gynurincola endophyticus]|jgi:transmembrane sensor|uniref:FecR family protein n=1 Tax=Gynurincola endophyticus TaxID=2479004 RepID=UPI000F8D1156|nr:FecR family protein [Gynurincola endophyticus]